MTDFDTTPLIIDDDGSQDRMSAIAYMLANPEFDVRAITISNGIANPEVFGDNLLRMLDRLGDLARKYPGFIWQHRTRSKAIPDRLEK